MAETSRSRLRWITRRGVLGGLIAGFACLTTLPAVAQSLSRLTHPGYRIGNRAIGPVRAQGQPRFHEPFNDHERAIVTRLVEMIVPSDDLPGARETGTAGAVLFALGEQDSPVIKALRQAIAVVDAISVELFGQTFLELPGQMAEHVTQVVAQTSELDPFWSAVRNLTVLDFYAHEAGYAPPGLPGPTIDRGGFPEGRSTPGTVLCRS